MKVSEAFLRYIEPIAQGLPDPQDLAALEKTFVVPLAVWNASALDLWKGNRDRMSELENHMAKAPELAGFSAVEVVRYWLARKEALFPEAAWAFSDVKARRKEDGELVIRAEIRAPDEWEAKLPASWRRSLGNESEQTSCK